MRIAIGSDLHGEKNTITHKPFEADVVILAGDIAAGIDGIAYAKSLGIPTIYVPGNHEHEHQIMKDNIAAMRAAARGSNVHFLYNDVVEICGLTFAGTTLWTDFKYGGGTPDMNMFKCIGATTDHATGEPRTVIADFTHIYSSDGVKLMPHDVLAEHQVCREFVLNQGVNADVLITHFACCTQSAKENTRGDQFQFYYIVDMDMPLVYGQNKLIVHGHTHVNQDYEIADKRVVAHMRGYRPGPFEYKIVEV
jgi:predicted phosphodiesterase